MSIIVRHMKWLSVVILLWCSVSYAQTQSIVNIKLNADYICANQNSGEYTISFKWEGILPSNSNVFTMELSSPSGDFSSGTKVLATLASNASSRLLSIKFRATAGMSSDNYRIRIKSSDPVVEGISEPLSIHYLDSSAVALVLNNWVNKMELCSGQGRELAITEGVNATSYIWYKDGIVIPGKTGRSITVTEIGQYYVVPDMGQCGKNLGSNRVEVVASTSNSSKVSILGGSPQEKCKGGTKEIEAQVTNPIAGASYKYEWYKDGAKQAETTTNKTQISEFGAYYVIATPTGGCPIQSETINVVEKSSSGLITIPGGNTQLKCAGNTLALSVSTQLSGTLQWYKNSVAIPSANSSNYSVSDTGSYYVTITEASGCIYTSNIVAVKEKSDVDVADIKWLGVRDNSVIFFFNYRKPILELDISSASPFNIKWYRDNSLVQDDTKRTYQTEAGGVHKAEVYDTCGNKLAEKEIKVVEPQRFNVRINYTGANSCSSTKVTLGLTSLEAYDPVTNTKELVRESDYNGNYSFEWLKDNQVFATNVFEIEVNTATGEGIYRLKVNGAFNSQEIDIKGRPKPMPEKLNIKTSSTGKNSNVLGNKVALALIPYDNEDILTIDKKKTYKWYHNGQLIKEIDTDTDTNLIYTIPASDIELSEYEAALGDYKFVIEYTDTEIKDICQGKEASINIVKTDITQVGRDVEMVTNTVILSSTIARNRKWLLPITDKQKSNYEGAKITIYSQSGKVVFSTNNYDEENNYWPKEGGSDYQKNESDKGRGDIYFYVIEKVNGEIETGTITVLN